MHRLVCVAFAALIATAPNARASVVTVTVDGHYEFDGAVPSPTYDFALSFTLDQNPGCGAGAGLFVACGVSLPLYTDGALSDVLGTPAVLFRDAAHGGGFELAQSDLTLNRLGFVIGSSQLFSGALSSPTLLDGVFDIVPAHLGQVHLDQMTELKSYAGQGFASGDPFHVPLFQDFATGQNDDPILSGTVTISGMAVPEPSPVWTMLVGFLGLGMLLYRRRQLTPTA